MSGITTVTGTTGNDLLSGTTGADKLVGGAGDDTYIVNNIKDEVVEKRNGGTDTVLSAITYVLDANVENLTLTGDGATNATGNELNNVIAGNSAANVLDGGAGADAMSGGAGNDTYAVDNAGDVVTENVGEGTDTVVSSISYALGANVENLTLAGNAGNATGNAQSNVLTGNSGGNVLDGGAGADLMAGGSGNDTYIVDNAGDAVTENANQGVDTVQSSISYTLGANVENLTLTGAAAIDGAGNALSNVIIGNSAANILNGGAGTDLMAGGGGNDTYIVDSWGDTVVEGANQGTDTVYSSVSHALGANVENLTLTAASPFFNIGIGNSLNNVIVGNGGIDILAGRAGDDTLTGNGGVDYIDGGSGFDTAVYSGSFFDYNITPSQVSLGYGLFDSSRDADDDRESEACHPSTLVLNGVVVDDVRAGDPDGKDYVRNVEALQFRDHTIYLDGRDNAAIMSADTRNLTEAGSATAISTSGQLTITDFDGPDTFIAQAGTGGAYGTFVVATDGAWTYTASSAHDEFAAGSTHTDIFDVQSADGTHTSVTINIHGTNDAAVLSSATAVLDETNAPLTTGGQLTISDVDSAATFVEQSNVAGTYGAFAIAADGTWSYTANSAFDELNVTDTRSDTFAVVSVDGTATSVNVTIRGTNDAAVLSSATVELDETNAPLTTGGQLTISDVDSTATFVGQSNVAGTYGAFSIAADGTWSYTANSAFDELNATDTRSDTFAVASADGTATSVKVDIHGTNDDPVAMADTAAATENETLTIDVLANDTDADRGHIHTIVSASAPDGKGTASVVAHQLRFDPGTAFDHLNRTASEDVVVSYTMQDEHGATSTSEVVVTVTGVNDAPVALDDHFTVSADAAAGKTSAGSVVLGEVLTNDRDVDDGDVVQVDPDLVFAWDTDYGRVTLDADGTALISTAPRTNDKPAPLSLWQALAKDDSVTVSTDSSDNPLTYTITDGAASATANISFTIVGVNDAPTVSGNATGAGAEGSGVFTVNLLQNAHDIDNGAQLHVENVSGLVDGFSVVGNTLQVDTNNAAYDSLPVGAGPVFSVVYDVVDQHGARVEHRADIVITGVNDTPTAIDDSAEQYNNVVGTYDVLANDTDVDVGDAAAFRLVSVSAPASQGGAARLVGNRIEFDPGHDFDSLRQDERRPVSITYVMADESGVTSTARVTLEVIGTNVAPEAQDDKSLSTLEDTALALGITAPVDGDGDALGIVVTSVPTLGQIVAGTTAVAVGDTLTSAQLTALVFNPGLNQNGVAGQFSYTVSDGIATDSQTIAISIQAVNDAPVAAADTNAADAVVESGVRADNTLLAGDPTAQGNVLTNDVDVDLAAVRTVAAVNGTASNVGTVISGKYGTVKILASGDYTYTLNNADGDTDALSQGAHASEVFGYTVSDELGATSTSTLTIDITGTNDAPRIAGPAQSVALTSTRGTGNQGFTSVLGMDFDVIAPIKILTLGAFDSGQNGITAPITVAIFDRNTQAIVGPTAQVTSAQALVGQSRFFDVPDFVLGAGNYSIVARGFSNGNPNGNAGVGGAAPAIDTGGGLIQFVGGGRNFAPTGFALPVSLDAGPANRYDAGTFTYSAVNEGRVTEQITPAGNLVATGTIGFSDVDSGDAHLVSAAGAPIGSVLGALTAIRNSDTGASGTGGQLTWTYTVEDSAVEHLGAGQTRVESFNITVGDPHGGVATRQIDVAITGTNDAPVAATDTNAGGAVIEAGVSTAGEATATGNVLGNDTDVDANDTKTVLAVDGFASKVGTAVAGRYGSVVISADGTYTYTLDDADADTDALAQNESASDVFTYTMKDAAGAASSATLTIAITGSNDAVVISASNTTANGSTGEAADGSPAEQTNASHIASGMITFSDADAADVHGATATFMGAVWHKNGGATQALAGGPGALSFTPVDEAPASPAFPGAKTVGWNYAVSDSALDFLAQGETVDVTYNVAVSDGAGSTAVQQVTVTLNAANDAPVAVPDSNPGAPVVEAGVNPGNAVFAGNVFATGNATANDTDPDVTDTKSVVGAAAGTASGALAGGVGTTLLGTYGTLSIGSNGQWTYNLDNSDPDTQSLFQGQPTSDVFSYTVSDAAGAKSTTTLTVAISGTNDAPVNLALSSDKVGRNLADVTIGVLSASDPDNNALTYSIQPGANGSQFAIDGAQLKVGSTGISAPAGTVLFVNVRATDTSAAFVDKTMAIMVQDRTLVSLTTANDTVSAPADGSYVQGTAATLNAGDALNGNSGLDSLILYGAGAFAVGQLAAFNAFEEIQLINFSNLSTVVTLPANSGVSVVSTGDTKTFNLGNGSNHTITFTGNSNVFNVNSAASVRINATGTSNTYNLGSGSEAITGGIGIDTFVVNSGAALGALDALNGGAGFDTLLFTLGASGTADLRGTLQNIETLNVNATNGLVRLDQGSLGGFISIVGVAGSRISTAEATLDLRGKSITTVMVESTNATGTTFTVNSASAALQVFGGIGQDTISTSTFAFTAQQRDQIFYGTSIEKIVDTSSTYLSPFDGNVVRLTFLADIVSLPAQGGRVIATSAQLNPADALTGGGGNDLLVLNGGGTFNLPGLAVFTDFEQVRFENESGTAGTLNLRNGVNLTVTGLGSTSKQYNLGTGAETISGGIGQDIFIASSNAALTAQDSLDGGAGTADQLLLNLLPGTFDLRVVPLQNIEHLNFNTTNGVLKIDQAHLTGFTSITGGTGSRLVTDEATLNLTGKPVTNLTVETSNATGTVFTVNSASTAFQITGGTGQDTLVANGFAFSSAQRDQIFLGASIETITDASGTYTTPLTGFVARLTTANEIITMPAAGGYVVATASQLGADSLTGGPGTDVLVLNGAGFYNLQTLMAFTGFEEIRLMNESGVASLVSQSGDTPTVIGIGAGTKQYQLGVGRDFIVGGPGSDTFTANGVTAVSALDTLDGGAGTDTLAIGVTNPIDLRGATLQNIETLNVSSNGSVQIDQAQVNGFTSITGVAGSHVVMHEASVNLAGKSITAVLVDSANAAGTNFSVNSVSVALQVFGGPGQDTITTGNFAFTAQQRDLIFYGTSVEKIVDTSGTYSTPLAGTVLRLTSSAESITMPAQGGYLVATSSQINGDSVAGGVGTDVLVLNGSGTFNLPVMSAFSGFEEIWFENDSGIIGQVVLRGGENLRVVGLGSSAKQYVLGTGNEAITGSVGQDSFLVQNAAGLTPQDSLDGGAGVSDLLQLGVGSGVTFDLRTISLQHIETLNFTTPNGVLKVDQAHLNDFTAITGAGGSRLVTDEAALNLTGKPVSNLSIESTNTTGTTFSVGSSAATAFLVMGGPGEDTLVADFAFTAQQRDAIFGGTSVDVIRDAMGIYGDSGNNTLVGTSAANLISGGAGNDRIEGGAGADTLTGGAGSDRFVRHLADTGTVDTITDFTAVPLASGGDVLDISELLIGYTAGDASTFMTLTGVGGNTTVSVDRDGAGTAFGFVDVAVLQSLSGQDLTTLLNQGNIFAG